MSLTTSLYDSPVQMSPSWDQTGVPGDVAFSHFQSSWTSGSERHSRDGASSVVAVGEPYWRGAAEDEAMQEEHGFLWRALLDTIDIDLAGRRVLDAGCNRGGFLRLLVDESGIAEGYGYDPASGAIDDARRLAGQRPLTFETAVTVPAGWAEFDAAFSHEVLYLLHDLASTPRRRSPRSSRGRRTSR